MKTSIVIAGMVMVGAIGAAYLYEQLKQRPVKYPDVNTISSANLDNSRLATAQVQAYGAFAPQQPAIPQSPYEWAQLQAGALQGQAPTQANGGIPPGGMKQ